MFDAQVRKLESKLAAAQRARNSGGDPKKPRALPSVPAGAAAPPSPLTGATSPRTKRSARSKKSADGGERHGGGDDDDDDAPAGAGKSSSKRAARGAPRAAAKLFEKRRVAWLPTTLVRRAPIDAGQSGARGGAAYRAHLTRPTLAVASALALLGDRAALRG